MNDSKNQSYSYSIWICINPKLFFMLCRTWWRRESLNGRLDTAGDASSSFDIRPGARREWAPPSGQQTCTRRIDSPAQNLIVVQMWVLLHVQLCFVRGWWLRDCLQHCAEVPRRGPQSLRRCRSLSRFSTLRRPTGTQVIAGLK